MITKITLNRWKSFQSADLHLDPLTILIGTNASGKSNTIDALDFLARIAQSKDLAACLEATENGDSFRGGKDWVTLRGTTDFQIVVQIDDSEHERFRYAITVQTTPRPVVIDESLERVKLSKNGKEGRPLKIFWTDLCASDAPAITARLYNTKRGTPRDLQRGLPVLTQLQLASSTIKSEEIVQALKTTWSALGHIFVLNTIPSHMRNFSSKSDRIARDGSNLAGVIAALPDSQKTTVEQRILDYVRSLPEKDIQRLEAELYGPFKGDAMLVCHEGWATGAEPEPVDARAMSDGTLRFIAIVTALLTLPEHTQLIVEEIDNGLHPSRANLLIQMLREIGQERKIDVIASTHNPALLDALGPEMVPFVVVAHRDQDTGLSRLTLLEDIATLPKLLAGGSLGKLASRRDIENALKEDNPA